MVVPPASEPARPKTGRPSVQGKFIFVGDQKLFVRGVTYGAFRPDASKQEYWDHEQIDRDFAQMAANGVNTVRIPHTMPPRSLLDSALRHGLYVMVGLSAEQYAGYLIDQKGSPDVPGIVRQKVRAVTGHPALLCYAIGNEIPAYMVRWIGRRRVERYLEAMCDAIKAEDPEGIVTYVNYPTTEYLQLPFLDLVCFNVYLEAESSLRAYLPRLQNIAGDRPLIMSEVGIDSMRNGEAVQAEVLQWQIRAAFECGCVGVFIFSWTDEWHRGGAEVDDWLFGITGRDRSPKPALAAVRQAFEQVPFSSDRHWPRVSVVVCSYNGSANIRDTLEGLSKVRYPDFEVIVVDDGSTDTTAAIAAEYAVKLIRTDNQGLSNARNTGWMAATGEIVAFTDDDAYPDPDWLTYLAETFRDGQYAGVGGPNIPPAGDGAVAACVGNAPGGPVHVLLSDTEAEHIPGCNMAFRRAALEEIGGFDPQFRVAGDDVDLCWRILERGWKLGFSPTAQVWHHSRNAVRTYWRQQRGYGKAEALLERKWPQKYNTTGHVTWRGRVYSPGETLMWGTAWRVYHGRAGSAPFQSLYQSEPGSVQTLFAMPESYLVIVWLLFLSVLGVFWRPLLLAIPFLALASAVPILNACKSAASAHFSSLPGAPQPWLFPLRALTAFLHVLQPAARLHGRVAHGLTLWRNRATEGFTWPSTRSVAVWTGDWVAPELRLAQVHDSLRRSGVPLQLGGDYDDWDLQIDGGFLGGARLLMAVEDHGAGTQYVRFRIRPQVSKVGTAVAVIMIVLSSVAAMDGAWVASGATGLAGIWLSYQLITQAGCAVFAGLKATKA